MILADSSALIEYYRPDGAAAVQAAIGAAIAADQVAINGIVQTELLAFAGTERAYRQLDSDFHAFHWLELTRDVFERAARLGYDLRRTGVTVPATDLIVAASALEAEAVLYHLDAHFERIAQVSDLKAQRPG